MKKIMMMAFLLLGAVMANAQNDSKLERVNKTPEQKAEAQVNRLTKKLNLTSDQQVLIKEICLASAKKTENLKNIPLTSDDRKTQWKQVETEKETQIKEKLTAEQNVKYDAMKTKMQEKRRDKKDKSTTE